MDLPLEVPPKQRQRRSHGGSTLKRHLKGGRPRAQPLGGPSGVSPHMLTHASSPSPDEALRGPAFVRRAVRDAGRLPHTLSTLSTSSRATTGRATSGGMSPKLPSPHSAGRLATEPCAAAG